MRYAQLIKNLVIIFSLIAMVWWFHLQNRQNSNIQEHTKPQEYMSNLTITNYTSDGNQKERLEAVYWAFVPKEGRSNLQNPHVTIYKENGDIWHLSSMQAFAWHKTMKDKVSQIDMMENVVIERTADNNAVPTKINTEQMQYFPPNQILSSDAYIAMQQPGITISGTGMLGNISQNWIELHEKITTVYTPTHN